MLMPWIHLTNSSIFTTMSRISARVERDLASDDFVLFLDGYKNPFHFPTKEAALAAYEILASAGVSK